MEAYSPNTTSCFSSQLTEMKLFQVITAGILWINICEFTSWIAIPKINLSRKTEKKTFVPWDLKFKVDYIEKITRNLFRSSKSLRDDYRSFAKHGAINKGHYKTNPNNAL